MLIEFADPEEKQIEAAKNETERDKRSQAQVSGKGLVDENHPRTGELDKGLTGEVNGI